MSAETRIVDWILSLETVSESADRAVRVTVSGQNPPVVELVGVVGRYSTGALSSTLADVATDASTRHHATTVDLFANAGLGTDPDPTGAPDARHRARLADLAADVRVVVDSPGGLVTIELTGDRRVGVWVAAGALRWAGMREARLAAEASAALAAALAELLRRLRAIHREPGRYGATAVTGSV